MADQCGDVHRRHGVGDGRGVVGETRELVCLPAAEQVQRRGRVGVEGNGGKADPAVAGDHRGHALRDFRKHVRRVEDDAVVVGVGVDEAGGEGAPADVLFRSSGPGRDRPGRSDKSNAVAADGDIAGEGRRAGTVEDEGVAEDVVVSGFKVAHRFNRPDRWSS